MGLPVVPILKLLPLALDVIKGKKKTDEAVKEVVGVVVETTAKAPVSTGVGVASGYAALSMTEGSIVLPEPLQPYALGIQGALYIISCIALLKGPKAKPVTEVPVEESQPETDLRGPDS